MTDYMYIVCKVMNILRACFYFRSLFLDYYYCYYLQQKIRLWCCVTFHCVVYRRTRSIMYKQLYINILSSNIYNQKIFFLLWYTHFTYTMTKVYYGNHYHFIDSFCIKNIESASCLWVHRFYILKFSTSAAKKTDFINIIIKILSFNKYGRKQYKQLNRILTILTFLDSSARWVQLMYTLEEHYMYILRWIIKNVIYATMRTI